MSQTETVEKPVGYSRCKSEINFQGSLQNSQANYVTEHYKVLQSHFEDLLGKNADHLNHMKGNCICGMCICGQCKCPKRRLNQDFKKGTETLYQKEYVKHPHIPQIDVCNPCQCPAYKDSQPMQLETVNRVQHSSAYFPKAELVAHQVTPYKKYTQQDERFFIPFSGFSSYKLPEKTNYGDIGKGQSLILKPPPHPTVMKDLAFNGSTFYRDNFIKHTLSKDKFAVYSNRSQFKNPISPELPFIFESSNQTNFRAFKTKKQMPIEKPKDYQSLPSFQGQFCSTSQADFSDKMTVKCPARLVLNKIYKEKLNAAS